MNDKLKEQAYQEWKISAKFLDINAFDEKNDDTLRKIFDAIDDEDKERMCWMNTYEAKLISDKMDKIIEYSKNIEEGENVVGNNRMIYLYAKQLKEYAVSKMETPTNKEQTK